MNFVLVCLIQPNETFLSTQEEDAMNNARCRKLLKNILCDIHRVCESAVYLLIGFCGFWLILSSIWYHYTFVASCWPIFQTLSLCDLVENEDVSKNLNSLENVGNIWHIICDSLWTASCTPLFHHHRHSSAAHRLLYPSCTMWIVSVFWMTGRCVHFSATLSM